MECNYSDKDFARYFSGEATPEEREQIEAWSRASIENQELFNAALFVWEKTLASRGINYDTEKALSTVHNKLAFDQPEKKNRKITLYSLVAVAAAAIIATLLVFSPADKTSVDNIAYSEIISTNEVKHLTLADGSEVWLNKNSKLNTPAELKGDEFKLQLEGEAYFQIKHNANRVFVVETKTSTIKVLGTAFNIKARDADNTNVLSVTDGKVLCSKKDSKLEKIVEKGKEAKIMKEEETIQVEEITSDNFLSWKTNVIKFRETPMKEVVETLENHYNVSIEITDTSLLNIPISSTIVDKPINEVFQLIRLASDDIVFLESTKGYQVTRKK